MTTVRVDPSNPDNYQPREFKLLPKGIFLFEIANQLKIEGAKSSSNQKIEVRLKCIDDADGGSFKGTTVFDTIALVPKSEYKLVHLALAAGTQTREQIKADGVDLDMITGKVVKADIDVEGPSTSRDGSKTYKERNRVSRYVFDKE
jgi:hypothetical protein